MEYAILDQLKEYSEPKREEYQKKNNCILASNIVEAEEPFNGSSPTIKAYIYKNYFMTSGPIDLLIIIREGAKDKKDTSSNGFKINNVEQAIFPLYMAKPNAFDLPALENPPELHPDHIKFIVEKRSLPKKKYNAEEFDPNKHKWNVNLIAETLGISNRSVADYCRIMNL